VIEILGQPPLVLLAPFVAVENGYGVRPLIETFSRISMRDAARSASSRPRRT
jgi:hypothetical protein